MTGNGWAPTAEQEAALAAYATGDDLIIEAGAGTGKTSTLVLLAKSSPDRRGQYIAFNKAIVKDSATRMPGHVEARTAHSLAMQAVGRRFSHRLGESQRMRSDDLARLMGIQEIRVGDGVSTKALAPSYLAGQVMQAVKNFCQSADPVPNAWRHMAYIEGIDPPSKEGKRTYSNNNAVRSALQPYLDTVWQDATNERGRFPYNHDYYLKLWQVSGPIIEADVIYFDEAQDVSPVLAAIVGAQRHAQLVYVGDSNQSIYEFTGAVDAMSQLNAARRAMLSQSFRFGQAVADIANRVLAELPTDMALTGYEEIPSTIGPVSNPDAILCRSNAAAVEALMNAQYARIPAHMVGEGKEVVAFARGRLDLRDRGRSTHRDLACFRNWGEVQEYVLADMQGVDLKLMVDLIDKFGAGEIIEAVQRMVPEREARLILSTAHSAKGREWNTVKLSRDFKRRLPEPGTVNEEGEPAGPTDEELRLLYVAVTRARLELDASAVPWVVDGRSVTPEPAAEPALELEGAVA